VLRVLFWRLLGAFAAVAGLLLIGWVARGGPGALLRGRDAGRPPSIDVGLVAEGLRTTLAMLGLAWHSPGVRPALELTCACAAALGVTRAASRYRRRYVRLRVEAYRTDRASAEALVLMFETLHKRILCRWWRRLLLGQPTVSLEVHHGGGAGAARSEARASAAPSAAWFAVCCETSMQHLVESALRAAYANCRLVPAGDVVGVPPSLLRLRKRAQFVSRAKVLDRFEQEREPPVNRLLNVMGACGQPAFVQIALTPAPAGYERLAGHLFRRKEQALHRKRTAGAQRRDRSMIDDAELRGALDLQHRSLFFTDIRVVGADGRTCEQIASELRVQHAENRLVELGTSISHGVLGLYGRRVIRGEGNPVPSLQRGLFATTELASLWQLPSVEYAGVPFTRSGIPVASASPEVFRPPAGGGILRDRFGPVSIHPELRRQNTAVAGTVEQGKSSFLAATVAEDLLRDRCAVIVIDPKGDAAEAAVGLVPAERTCTLLDFANPTCGFNPLAVDAPADVIADYVVGALKNLFTDADIRASSDRYLRNAIIAVLAHDRRATLWDAARLLSVGEEGYAYRAKVGSAVLALPELKEIAQFFTAELSAQLSDARSTTTAKLDAPVNKLARLLNSPSIKRILLNESLRVDFEQIIAGQEVLVVKGALGAMGAGNTAVLMQLLVGMLDAALARQQDLVAGGDRIAVALKVDEAPLILNRGFAETMALKRSAGLETVACWQTDSQWVDREVRDQLDALFAHRVYFATASAQDARAAVALTSPEFSDTIRPGIAELATLGRPDVRLHLPKHHAIASFLTPAGRQPPFVAETIPIRVDRERLAVHAERQRERGGKRLTDMRQPHWEGTGGERAGQPQGAVAGPATVASRAPAASPAPGARAVEESAPAPSNRPVPGPSYAELAELDNAHTARRARRATNTQPIDPDERDLEMLLMIARLQHVLSSQLHRRFNPSRAHTTTQRRLKRLADAGLVERTQFHRADGGGVPMCYLISPAGLALLVQSGRLDAADPCARPAPSVATDVDAALGLRRARRDIHVAGWALALALAVNRDCTLLGSASSVLSPPPRPGSEGPAPLGPGDLRLPGGRVPHDFLRSTPAGERLEVDRFETIRPGATVLVPLPHASSGARERAGARADPSVGHGESNALAGLRAIDVMVELDDRLPPGPVTAKLERYDHFLTGWSLHTRRYGRRQEAAPVVVFVCRDRPRARELARRADRILGAARAYAGEYPFDWEYTGRERIRFAAERDVHDGLLFAYGIPPLPPGARVAAAQGDPAAAEARAETAGILPPGA